MTVSTLIVFAGCLVAAVFAFRWNDGYHALYGGLMMIPLATAVSFFRSRWRRRSGEARSTVVSTSANVASATKWSAFVVAYLWAGFQLLSFAGVWNPFEDSGRIDFSRRLGDLEQREAYGQAITLIDEKLLVVTSQDWHAELESRLYSNLILAGKQLTETNNLEEATALLKRATDVACTQHDILLAEVFSSQVKQRMALRDAGGQFRSHAQWLQLSNLLRAVCILSLEHQWDGDAKADLYDALVKLGRSATTLEEAESAFDEAVSVARQFEIDGQAAASLHEDVLRLHQLEADGQLTELIVLLKRRMEQFPPTQSADLLYRTLLQSAEKHPDLNARLPMYREAETVQDKYGLNSDEATKRIANVVARVGDRDTFRARVDELRSQNKFLQLIDLLQQRIDSRPPDQWDFPLGQWLLDAHCREADRSDLQTRVDLCRKATHVAKKYDLDSSDVDARLAAAERELQQRHDFLARLRKLREQGRYTELLSVLNVHAESPSGEWLLPVGPAMYVTWIEWGDATSELAARLSRYEQAMAVAERFSLECTEAEAKRDKVRNELDRLATLAAARVRPRGLPLGAKAALFRVSVDSYPPSLIAYIEVRGGDGQAIKELEPKDFEVKLGGDLVENVALAPIAEDPSPANAIFLFDTSGSTSASLPVAVQGLRTSIDQLAMDNLQVRIAAFNSKITPVCSWTSRKSDLLKCLTSLKSGGETALYLAVKWAAEELSGRPGERCVVVFTDGKNTVGDVTLEATIAACQRSNVRVHAIGLRTNDLDSTALATLSAKTGGQYVEASHIGELPGLLAALSSQVRRHFYRAVLTPKVPPPLTNELLLCVHVGGENGVDAASPLSELEKSGR